MQEETFDIDVAKKTILCHSIDLAKEEMKGNIRHYYYTRTAQDNTVPDRFFEAISKGPYTVYREFPLHSGEWRPKVFSKMQGKENYVYDHNTNLFIETLAEQIYNDHNIAMLQTFGQYTVFSDESEKNRQHFYAKPYDQGSPRNNWAVFDLSEDGDPGNARSRVPCHMKCFLDLSSLSEENCLLREPRLYAIVEPTKPCSDVEELRWSLLLDTVVKKKCTLPGCEDDWNHQELVNLKRLVRPAALVPDMGNPNGRVYLKIVERKHWSPMFCTWLEAESM